MPAKFAWSTPSREPGYWQQEGYSSVYLALQSAPGRAHQEAQSRAAGRSRQYHERHYGRPLSMQL